MKRYYLVFEFKSDQKTIYPLLEATMIGRDTSNSIVLSDATASRKHARVRFWQGSWMVEDLGSANEIIINGERVEKTSIKRGDSFNIGEAKFSLVAREIAESNRILFTQPCLPSLQSVTAWRVKPQRKKLIASLKSSQMQFPKFPSYSPQRHRA